MDTDQHERVRCLLTDTVSMLCKNGLQFNKNLKVEGLIGITIDDSDVFLVHLNERFPAQGSSGVKKSNGASSQNKAENIKKSSRQEEESVSGTSQDLDTNLNANDSNDFSASEEPGVVSEMPASPSRKRRKRRSSRGSRANSPTADAESIASSPGISIKCEPTIIDDDDDLLIVNSEVPKSRTTGNALANSLGLVSFEGGYSDFESGSSSSKRPRPSNIKPDPIDPSGGAFVTGLIKNTSGEEVPLDSASWNSIGNDMSGPVNPLVTPEGLSSALMGEDSKHNLSWSGGHRNNASASQGSSNQSDSCMPKNYIQITPDSDEKDHPVESSSPVRISQVLFDERVFQALRENQATDPVHRALLQASQPPLHPDTTRPDITKDPLYQVLMKEFKNPMAKAGSLVSYPVEQVPVNRPHHDAAEGSRENSSMATSRGPDQGTGDTYLCIVCGKKYTDLEACNTHYRISHNIDTSKP